MIALSVVGITVNWFAAYKLSEGKTLNERVINWHLLEDVLGWVAVLSVGIVLLFVDWPIIDPMLSIGFTLFILVNVLRNLWATLKLFIQATSDKDTYQQIADALLKLPHVADLHHLLFWSLDGEEHVLTVHLVLTKNLNI